MSAGAAKALSSARETHLGAPDKRSQQVFVYGALEHYEEETDTAGEEHRREVERRQHRLLENTAKASSSISELEISSMGESGVTGSSS